MSKKKEELQKEGKRQLALLGYGFLIAVIFGYCVLTYDLPGYIYIAAGVLLWNFRPKFLRKK